MRWGGALQLPLNSAYNRMGSCTATLLPCIAPSHPRRVGMRRVACAEGCRGRRARVVATEPDVETTLAATVCRPLALAVAMGLLACPLALPMPVAATPSYTMPSSRTYVDQDANTQNIPSRISGTLGAYSVRDVAAGWKAVTATADIGLTTR